MSQWQFQKSMAWRAYAALSLLLGAGMYGASASHAASPLKRELSSMEMSALSEGASQYPYATLALLYLLEDAPADRDRNGVVYLQSVPKYALTSLLLESPDNDGIMTLVAQLLWNLYSASQAVVQVRWSLRTNAMDGEVLEFRTNLLLGSHTGAFSHPPPEAATAVLVKGGRVWFLGPGELL